MIKPKPTFFSQGNYPKPHNLSKSSDEVDGFLQRQQQEETVQKMLNKAANIIVFDVKKHPPKRT